MRGPLADVTVVALEQAVSAPMCTRTLADLGARVIKVENPRGGDFARHYDDVVGGLGAHFVWANRGKESVTLDLKTEPGLGLLHRLLDRADVLVSNLTPGTTDRLGVAPGDLAARHPGVIGVEIDGYGPGGPLSHKRAYDLLVQAESGACSITGHPGAPAKPGPPVADTTTGLYAALSIVALLYEGRGSGLDGARGSRLDGARGSGCDPAPSVAVSLFDTMTELMGYALTYTRHSGLEPDPLGMSSPAVAPYGAYRTADGQTVVLGTTNDREWQRLATELIQRPDLAADDRFRTNTGRCAHRELLDKEIAVWCARHDLSTVQDRADRAGIGNSRYNTPSDVNTHPHLTARDRWRGVATPAGEIPALLPPPVISGYEARMGAVPGLGEHTESVLGELGLSAGEIAALREGGMIGEAPEARGAGVTAYEARNGTTPVLLTHDTPEGIRTLTLNRPHRKNALDTVLWSALHDALVAVGEDRSVRALVLTGAGGAFCSGADLSSPRPDTHPLHRMRTLTDVALLLHELPVPTIAKVTGVAVGAGWNLALGCDLVAASPGARFSQIFARRGLSLDLGGSWLLPRHVGLQQAKRLSLLAETIDAEEAHALGLVTWVVPEEEIDGYVEELAVRLAQGPAIALAQSKALLNEGMGHTLREALSAEARAQAVNFATADAPEAYAAFAEQRAPVFTGTWAVPASAVAPVTKSTEEPRDA